MSPAPFDPLKGTKFSRFRKEAEEALKKGAVTPIVFSHATYQMKVVDEHEASPLWTFLQFQEKGGVEDAFCSCVKGDDKEGCWHLAASLLKIYNHTALPLHLRFEKSRWFTLGMTLWAEMEGGEMTFEFLEDQFRFFDREGKPLLIIKPRSLKTLEQLKEFVIEEATEETSIKFSNLSEEELILWREGRPPASLQFEISPLSDLMKWCFMVEEDGTNPLDLIEMKFPQGEINLGDKKENPSHYIYDEERGVLKDGAKEWSGVELSLFLDQKLREGSIGELSLPFEREKVSISYALRWKGREALEIEAYLEKLGDLKLHGAWAYHKERGLLPVKDPQFSQEQVTIPKEEVSDFVLKNRIWLNRQKGFETHLLRSDSLLGYRVSPEGEIHFFAHQPSEEEGWIDCGGWLYFQGEGFFPREGPMGRNHPFAGRVVPTEKVVDFIHENLDLLINIPGFFAATSPIRKLGLKVVLGEESILIEPSLSFLAGIQKGEILKFGPYLYQEKKGFSSLTIDPRFPSAFLEKQEIPKQEWQLFFEAIYPFVWPYVIECSKELVPLKEPELFLTRFSKVSGGRIVGELLVGGKKGSFDPYLLKGKKERFEITEAGLVDRKDSIWGWIDETEKEMPPWKWLKVFLFLHPNSEKLALKDKRLLEKLLSLEEPTLPPLKHFVATLRHYQEIGLKWLYSLYERGFSGLLADDMGLGKTLQALALIAALFGKRKKIRCLIICPTSVLFHWKDKIEAFMPGVPFTVFHGTKRELDSVRKRETPLLITSYGVVKRDLKKLKKIAFDLIIFDEIQMAKNHTSLLWEALTQLKGGMLLGLSGTPVENRLRELKALFDLLLPGYFPNETRFREDIIVPIEKEGKNEVKGLLRKITAPFILRRTKGEVLQELPEKIEEIAHCEMTEEQRALYLEVLKREKKPLLDEIEEGKTLNPLHVFALLQKLKAVADHPALYYKNPALFDQLGSGKWNLYQELLEEALASGQKVVVFTQSLQMLKFFAEDLEKKAIGYSLIQGSTRDREGAVKKFQEEDDCKVFLASLKAGGVGIDLTAASVVIHYDRWWNPAKEDQATDRVHRIGQSRGVQVFKLMTLDTIEERIQEILKAKGALSRGLFMQGGDIPSLTRDELLFLLKTE